jgi:hypothetical protein
MPSVVAEIKRWAKQLPYWEQAALEKILAGYQFTDAVYDELLQYLFEDAGLTESAGKRPPLQILDSITDDTESTIRLIRLEKIFNMENINALVSGQTLIFCPALTAIYGATGSGKSGYARVLGCAGFTRGDKEVFPDLTKPFTPDIVLSADIEIFDGSSTRVINYHVGTKCPELAQCYVFDSTSVHVHLMGSNAFSFSPAGLSYLTQLSEVTDSVRDRLNIRIEQYSQPHNFTALFPGESSIKEFIEKLGSDTDLDELSHLAALTAKDRKRMQELDTEIAKLKSRDISKETERISQTMKDLSDLRQRILSAERMLSDEAINTEKDAVNLYLERESLAQRLSVDQFQTERFTQIGTDIWQRFIESAKILADAESSGDFPYPQIGDYCLLCHQPLSNEARELLIRLWQYLEGDAQTKLEQAEKALIGFRRANDSLDLDFFTDQSIFYRHLQEHDPSLVKTITAFIESCRVRRSLVYQLIDTHQPPTFLPLPVNGTLELQNLIDSLDTQCQQLKTEDPAERIKSLSQEYLMLQHCDTLHQHFNDIKTYVENRKWAERASAVGGDTKHITSKYKELFSSLVTDRYLKLFKQLLSDLQRPLNVYVKTTGRKGKTYKQIVLQLDETAPPEIATPDKILSEGEKRAVALADFLTEVALDTTSNSIILDDPVTSLDLEWREMIASILAKEAKLRQVIVFTHDLPFLYYLKKHAETNSVQIKTHWIQRINNKPGYVSLNNSPALEREYRKPTKPREYYEKAKGSSGTEQQDYLRLGFGALRTCYEAFVVYDLFEEVIMRFDERISFGRLRNIRWDDSIVNEANKKYELLSKYIEGHLHTNGLNPLSDPKILLGEIEAFDDLRRRLRQIKKSSS